MLIYYRRNAFLFLITIFLSLFLSCDSFAMEQHEKSLKRGRDDVEEDSPSNKRTRRAIIAEFFVAIDHGEIDKIKEMLKERPSLLDKIDSNGNTPLHRAIEEFQTEVALWLIEQINQLKQEEHRINLLSMANGVGNTPLLYAVEMGMLEVVKSLVNSRLPTHCFLDTVGGLTVLEIANSNAHNNNDAVAIQALMVEYNEKALAQLFEAIDQDNDELIKRLILEDNQWLFIKDEHKNTLLNRAIEQNKTNIACWLIEQISNDTKEILTAENDMNFTPLYNAVLMGDAVIVSSLINRGVTISDSLLSVAVENDYAHIAEMLLAHGANPETVDQHDLKPVNLTSNIAMLRLLFGYGAHCTDFCQLALDETSNFFPLEEMIIDNHPIETVSAEISQKDSLQEAEEALYIAAGQGKIEWVTFLLARISSIYKILLDAQPSQENRKSYSMMMSRRITKIKEDLLKRIAIIKKRIGCSHQLYASYSEIERTITKWFSPAHNSNAVGEVERGIQLLSLSVPTVSSPSSSSTAHLKQSMPPFYADGIFFSLDS